jgi:hypothetical protein
MPACHCTPAFDVRCCCLPPSAPLSCKYGTDEVGWFKHHPYTDNWDGCDVRVGTALWVLGNSRCLHDDGGAYPQWREACALIGLSEAETAQVVAMRQEEDAEDEDEDADEAMRQEEAAAEKAVDTKLRLLRNCRAELCHLVSVACTAQRARSGSSTCEQLDRCFDCYGADCDIFHYTQA